MSGYGNVDAGTIKELAAIVGERAVIADRERMADYSHDEYTKKEIRHFPDVVVKPATAGEVSRIMKLCSERRIPVTARGGATGLCGGSVPVLGGVALSLEAMNRVVEIDPANQTATVEAGLTLKDFYAALGNSGLFFPPHPGDESATMGGVAATNAGGSRAIKYGVIRNFVKGLEVVLADGRIERIGGKFVKNSSGYSLLNLLIGSEGTLAIITQATFSLMAAPAEMITLVAPFNGLSDAIAAVPALMRSGVTPMAVEFLDRESVLLGEAHLGRQWPVRTGEAYLMIILDGPSEDDVFRQAEAVAATCAEHSAQDVFIADSRQKQENILTIRSHIYESMKDHMLESLDITVPRAEIARFVGESQAAAQDEGLWLPTYGHAADGNVHHHLMRDRWKGGVWTEIPGWKEKTPRLRARVHELGLKFGGIVSGEHGIGLAKKEYLASFVGETQLGLMRGIKKVFDPQNILNPGKILDPD